jgi:hypothetical protein
MSKIILEFDAETEGDQAKDAINVWRYKMALRDYDNHLRRFYKHGGGDDLKNQIAQEFHDMLFTCLKEADAGDII